MITRMITCMLGTSLLAVSVPVSASEHCAADLNNDGVVNSADLAMLLGSWGPCTASCVDGILNGGESDVDCGGDECPTCEAGQGCLDPCDCESGICEDGICTPGCVPQLEVCDGVDNDCNPNTPDGSADPVIGMTCDTGLPGVCELGTMTCQGGVLVCQQLTQPGAELCDNLDNNCNGIVDEANPQGGAICNTGLPGICALGTTVCQNGVLGCVQNSQPFPEICDSMDNNCNGIVDEGNPGGGNVCNTGLLGVCAIGTISCQNGALFCVQNNQPSPEVCDGLDNNCNGSVDEGNPGGGAPCDGADTDLCTEGLFMCIAGSLTCSDSSGNNIEICDGFDNDCDGFTDEGCEP